MHLSHLSLRILVWVQLLAGHAVQVDGAPVDEMSHALRKDLVQPRIWFAWCRPSYGHRFFKYLEVQLVVWKCITYLNISCYKPGTGISFNQALQLGTGGAGKIFGLAQPVAQGGQELDQV